MEMSPKESAMGTARFAVVTTSLPAASPAAVDRALECRSAARCGSNLREDIAESALGSGNKDGSMQVTPLAITYHVGVTIKYVFSQFG
jgi:hypothetical protein